MESGISRKTESRFTGKKIVIIGGGFGGLQVALNLEKGLNGKDFQITLVDKREYHLFTPNLYEVATAEEELATVSQIKKSITLPFKDLLQGKKIEFVQGAVTMVEAENNLVKLASKSISYDYLVLAIGSQSDYFNIEGAQKYSLPLKDFTDALRIRNNIEFVISSQKYSINQKNIRIIFAGGGYTGLELACEMKGLIDYLSWKYQIPRNKIEIEIIEGSSKLIPGFDDRLSADAYERLKDLGIHIRLSSRIVKVDEYFVWLDSGEKVAYNTLIWTAGVKANPVTCSRVFNLDRKDRICVNKFFQVEPYQNIFAIGDLANMTGVNGQPVPCTAQDAWAEAKYLADALPLLVKNQRPKPFQNHKHGFIVNLGGKWAIVDYNLLYVKGFLGAVIGQFAHLRYYISVVGLWGGIKWLLFQEDIFSRND